MNEQISILELALSQKHNPLQKKKILSCFYRLSDWVTEDVVNELHVSSSSVNNWLKNFNQGGLEKLLFRKPLGRKKIIPTEALPTLKSTVIESQKQERPDRGKDLKKN
jgi:hypothetical protein